jgi:hypothetical protein
MSHVDLFHSFRAAGAFATTATSWATRMTAIKWTTLFPGRRSASAEHAFKDQAHRQKSNTHTNIETRTSAQPHAFARTHLRTHARTHMHTLSHATSHRAALRASGAAGRSHGNSGRHLFSCKSSPRAGGGCNCSWAYVIHGQNVPSEPPIRAQSVLAVHALLALLTSEIRRAMKCGPHASPA